MQKLMKVASTYTASGMQEYSLVVYPSLEATTKINAEKHFFNHQYGQTNDMRPNIAIANFLAKDMMEETILRFLQRIFSHHFTFEIALNNYSGFPPNSIYLRVQNQQPFKQLAKDLMSVNNYIHSYSCPPIKLISNPHVSIADQLPETVYLKAIADYSHKDFFEKFTVNEIILLRKSNAFDSCKTVQVFSLFPQSISTKKMFN